VVRAPTRVARRELTVPYPRPTANSRCPTLSPASPPARLPLAPHTPVARSARSQCDVKRSGGFLEGQPRAPRIHQTGEQVETFDPDRHRAVFERATHNGTEQVVGERALARFREEESERGSPHSCVGAARRVPEARCKVNASLRVSSPYSEPSDNLRSARLRLRRA
jgi:hypothetical protein